MIIISKGILHEFGGKYPLSAASLNDWYARTKHADWRNPSDMLKAFNTVDTIGNDRYVFNISGNRFRLIAMVHFGIRTVYIRGIFTHSEYDRLLSSGRLYKI